MGEIGARGMARTGSILEATTLAAVQGMVHGETTAAREARDGADLTMEGGKWMHLEYSLEGKAMGRGVSFTLTGAL